MHDILVCETHDAHLASRSVAGRCISMTTHMAAVSSAASVHSGCSDCVVDTKTRELRLGAYNVMARSRKVQLFLLAGRAGQGAPFAHDARAIALPALNCFRIKCSACVHSYDTTQLAAVSALYSNVPLHVRARTLHKKLCVTSASMKGDNQSAHNRE